MIVGWDRLRHIQILRIGTSRTWPSLCYGRGQQTLRGMTPVTELAFWAHCPPVKQNHALPCLLVSDPSQTIFYQLHKQECTAMVHRKKVQRTELCKPNTGYRERIVLLLGSICVQGWPFIGEGCLSQCLPKTSLPARKGTDQGQE